MTELIWDGKYKDGKKVAPVRIALPFQTIETVNESSQERQRALDLFSSGNETEWRNRLIWGDKKYVLPSLLPEFSGKVSLIYIDPPFDTGADFSYMTSIPDYAGTSLDEAASFVKEPSILEQKAYRDTWGRGLESYLQWFYETVSLLRDLLEEDGSIYVHLDSHIGHYAKLVLDEIFGSANFKNEIVWKRSLPHNDPKKYGAIHDTIFFYVRNNSSYRFLQQFTGLSDAYKESHYSQVDSHGRRYQLTSLSASGAGPARRFGDRLLQPPKGTHWRYSQKRIDQLMSENRIIFTAGGTGGTPRYIRYMEEMRGPALQSIWSDVNPVNSQAAERLDYSTQKPEALLERIIKASSRENDLMLDCFCGSGTTAVVAEKLGRKWIACDLGRFAIHATRKRLLGISNVKPFIVQNLGKYERQEWQSAEFESPENLREKELRYRRFILDLYHSEPISGYSWVHGAKSGRMVHVGAVDAPVTLSDVKAIAAEVWKAVGTGKDAPTKAAVDILGWEFSFELNELAKQVAAEARVDVAFRKIPREVLEKKAVEQGDIKFFELAALSVNVKHKARNVTVKMTDFVLPTDDIPEEVRKAIKHWSQMIDYWAIDWDYKDDTFHNQWQSYRTRKNVDLELEASHAYVTSGRFLILVKVIDLLGNDTTKTLQIEIK